MTRHWAVGSKWPMIIQAARLEISMRVKASAPIHKGRSQSTIKSAQRKFCWASVLSTYSPQCPQSARWKPLALLFHCRLFVDSLIYTRFTPTWTGLHPFRWLAFRSQANLPAAARLERARASPRTKSRHPSQAHRNGRRSAFARLWKPPGNCSLINGR